ncbi:MAG: SRPBCC family protein [Thermoleophilia bacterium]
MPRIEERVEVGVPVRTAYDQWTQFEQFPSFMDGVQEIEQLDDTHLHWKVRVAGQEREFDARITEQIPDARIAWKSVNGPKHAGAIDFHRVAPDRTELHLVMDVEPEGGTAKMAAAEGLVRERVHGDLQRFKRMIESRGTQADGWRGEVRPEGSGEGMTKLDTAATALVTVGALNWGLVGLARFDLVGRLLAGAGFGRTSAASRVVYGLVGAAGAYSVARFALRARRT